MRGQTVPIEEAYDRSSMYEFSVLMYAPGLKPGGVQARLSFRDNVLEVRGPGLWYPISADRVRLATGGYDGRQWLLAWDTQEGRVSAMLRGASDMRMMARIAPPAIVTQINRGLKTLRRRQRRFGGMWAVLAVLFSLPFLAAILFWANAQRIAGWAAEQVSVADEMRLGELAFAQLRPGLKLVESGTAVEVLSEVGERLTRGAAYRYRWHLSDDPQVNAFALPGGQVVVHTGLLRAAESAEELAGVLAHEVQHVERRHTLKKLVHELGWRAVWAVALGDLSGGVWAGMAQRLGSLKYDRDLEREADLGGLAALRQAGIAPHGLVGFFARQAKAEGPRIALLSTHPAGEERLRDLRQAIAAQGRYAAAPLPYNWPAIRRLPAGAELGVMPFWSRQ